MTRETDTPTSVFERESYLLSFALLILLIHMAVNVFGAYGYFRDEFYYIACSDHLDWGYVDQPPLSIAILKISRFIFGDSLVGLRFLPAVAAAATVFLTGLMARQMGGGRFAQGLACVAVIASPMMLGMTSIYSMNSFDILIWASVLYVSVLLVKSGERKLWIWLGVLLGLGLMNKISVLWLGAGLAVGIVATPERRWLKTPWPWISAVIAALFFLPYVLWNMAHDYAHLEFIRNATEGKYSSLTSWEFVVNQFVLQNPASIFIWVGGLWFFFSRRGSQYRILGYVYVTAFLILLLNGQSKAEYLSPAYPALFAGGGVMVGAWLEGKPWKWAKPVLMGLPALVGLTMMPFAVNVLPVETFIRYSEKLGVAPSTAENLNLEKLPQFYADMFGWEELTTTVLISYESLPITDHGNCLVYAQNYGEAGALTFLGKQFGMPPVISGHNNYHIWGPKFLDSTTVVLVVGGREEDHLQSFTSVEEVARSSSKYGIPYENNLPVFVCRGLKRPVAEVWPQTKHYM